MFYRLQENVVIVELVGRKKGNVLLIVKGFRILKIESLRDVKAKLSKIVKELPSEKSVVITKTTVLVRCFFP